MIVVIPFHAGDKALSVHLAERIAELGGVSKYDCLLAVHKDTDSVGVIEPLRKAFGRVAEFSITDEMIVEREQHAYAANLMWKRTANHIADMNEPAPWLWLEPDAVPISKNWLDSIAGEYAKCGKPFLHDLVETPRGRSNSGCGVYPASVRNYTDRLWELSNVSWDILLYGDFAPHTAYTPLIQDIGFLPETKELPTFPDEASLSILRPGAVIFHRVKDGSLFGQLRKQEGGDEPCAHTAKSTSKTHASELQTGASVAIASASNAAPTFQPEGAVISNLKDRIAILETENSALKRYIAENPPAKTAQRTKKSNKRQRTPEEQAAIDARMAKARAARKSA